MHESRDSNRSSNNITSDACFDTPDPLIPKEYPTSAITRAEASSILSFKINYFFKKIHSMCLFF